MSAVSSSTDTVEGGMASPAAVADNNNNNTAAQQSPSSSSWRWSSLWGRSATATNTVEAPVTTDKNTSSSPATALVTPGRISITLYQTETPFA